MYIWAARVQAKRDMRTEATEAMAKTRDMVSSIAGFPFYAWAGVAGEPMGTLFLSARVDSMEQYMATSMAVVQDDDYNAQVKASAEFSEGPTETMLSQVVGMAGEMGSEPAPMVVTTMATAAPGRQGGAVAWGVDVLDHVHGLTGTAGIFTMAVVGNINQLAWIQNVETGADIDRIQAAVMADDGYLERVRAGGDLLVAGSSHRTVMVRLP